MSKGDLGVRVDALWDQFHQVVNMTSGELRDFLLADAADAEGVFPDQPDLGIDPDGRRVLRVLAKRRADLTEDDVEVMDRVLERVTDLRATRAASGLDDALWRRELMTLGHDPLRDETVGG